MTIRRTDTELIQSVVVRIAHHIDAKRWSDLRELYAAEVDVDYRSLNDGPQQRFTSETLVAGWRTQLNPVTTQHLLGSIDVTVDEHSAIAECHVRARHVLKGLPGGDEWVVFGHYVIGLRRHGDTWLIQSMKLDTFDQTGNRKLLEQAGSTQKAAEPREPSRE